MIVYESRIPRAPETIRGSFFKPVTSQISSLFRFFVIKIKW